jgi:cytidylate kinase
VPIITLSRGSKSGGLALVELLAKELKCNNIISREVLVKVSEEYGITENVLNEAMEKPPKFWERSTGNPRHLYLTYIRAALLEYASYGCMIYHGHAGHFLLADVEWVLKVRLIAPLEQRIGMLQKSRDVDRAQAIQYITKVDEDRERWTKFLYGEDWSDPGHFDLVINLRTMSLETARDTIMALSTCPEFIRTPDRDRDLKNKALAAKVQAAYAANPKTRDIEIGISAYDGIVNLHGRVAHDNIAALLIDVASGLEGVKDVKDNIIS